MVDYYRVLFVEIYVNVLVKLSGQRSDFNFRYKMVRTRFIYHYYIIACCVWVYTVLRVLYYLYLCYVVCCAVFHFRRAQEMLLSLQDDECQLAQAIAFGAKIPELGKCLDTSSAHMWHKHI